MWKRHRCSKRRNQILRLASVTFAIETLNTFVHSLSSLESHHRFQTKMCKVYSRFQTKTAQKPYLYGRVKYVNRFLYWLNGIFCPITYLLVFRQLARKRLKWDLHHRVYVSAKGEVNFFYRIRRKKTTTENCIPTLIIRPLFILRLSRSPELLLK